MSTILPNGTTPPAVDVTAGVDDLAAIRDDLRVIFDGDTVQVSLDGPTADTLAPDLYADMLAAAIRGVAASLSRRQVPVLEVAAAASDTVRARRTLDRVRQVLEADGMTVQQRLDGARAVLACSDAVGGIVGRTLAARLDDDPQPRMRR